MSFRVASHTRSAWWLRTGCTCVTTGWRNVQVSLSRPQELIVRRSFWLVEGDGGGNYFRCVCRRRAGRGKWSEKPVKLIFLTVLSWPTGVQSRNAELLSVQLLLQEEHDSLLSIWEKTRGGGGVKWEIYCRRLSGCTSDCSDIVISLQIVTNIPAAQFQQKLANRPGPPLKLHKIKNIPLHIQLFSSISSRRMQKSFIWLHLQNSKVNLFKMFFSISRTA